MPVTITSGQRDALYDRILDRLSGIGDIELSANSGDFPGADRLGREYSDELRLVCDDLGWGAGPQTDVIELTRSSDVLLRVFGRMLAAAASERTARATNWDESRFLEKRNRLVEEVCEVALATLAGEGIR